MPFKGSLKQVIPFDVEIDNSANTEQVAYTILKVNRRDRIASADHRTVPAGGSQAFTDAAANTVERVIILINPGAGMLVPVRVVQGASAFADPGDGDTQLVFDAAP